MAFTKALYYPWIEIQDQGWLKNAMLYWEQIQTIVPISLQNPYSTKTAKEFYDAGLLVPSYVESDMQAITELTEPVLRYLDSPEGTNVLFPISEQHYIYSDKLPNELRRMIEMYPEKLSHEIRYRLEDTFSGGKRNNLFSVDARFANFYMTLLATNLSEKSGLGLLTSSPPSDRLSTAVRLDSHISFRETIPSHNRRFMHNINVPRALAQGMLADLIIAKITIDPETSVSNILRFKNQRSDELGRFRTKIDELTKSVSTDQPITRLRQGVEDIYTNEVLPAINSLKATLTDSGIKWTADNLVKVTVYSTGSTSIPLLLGLATPYALLVGAGVSLTASVISYNRDKADKLRQNPFSYLIASEKEFQPKSDIPLVTPL
jgi:hypothetical protein